jgi:hypothetical protein
MDIQIRSLALAVASNLDNNELGQLAEILDNSPTMFLEAINEIAMERIPEIFNNSTDDNKKG